MPTRRRSGSTQVPSPATIRPPIDTVPASGTSNPAITRSNVVFPEPLGPSRATTWPWATSTVASSTALVPLNDFTMPRRRDRDAGRSRGRTVVRGRGDHASLEQGPATHDIR